MINETPIQTFIKAEQILNPFHLEMLSRDAKNLYSTVWNRFKKTTQKTLWMYDRDVAIRSRIKLERLPAAQAELVRTGLIHLTPGAVQSRYELLPIEADETQD
jgi:hypothetical protein